MNEEMLIHGLETDRTEAAKLEKERELHKSRRRLTKDVAKLEREREWASLSLKRLYLAISCDPEDLTTAKDQARAILAALGML